MKTWKKIMIVALSVLAVAVTLIAIFVVCIYYQEYHEKYCDEDNSRYVSENIVMDFYSQRRTTYVRLRDDRTNEYTTPALQHVFLNEPNSPDSLVVFSSMEMKRGYLNINTGQIIIPAKYDHAWNFSEGLAVVAEDGRLKLIQSDGQQAVSTTFPIPYNTPVENAIFQFHNGICVMVDAQKRWGLINTQGEWCVEPQYTAIGELYHGYRFVRMGGKYGVIRANGQIELPLEYDEIRYAEDGVGFLLAKDGICQKTDSQLIVTEPFVYDHLYVLDYALTQENESDEINTLNEDHPFFLYGIGNKTGLINAQGKVIIPAIYYYIRQVNDQLFEVEVSRGGEHMLFDAQGNQIKDQ